VTTVAIVLAGGSGTRMAHAENKVYLPLGGRPLLAWSLDMFERSDAVDELVLVVRGGDEDRAQQVVDDLGLTKLATVVVGGATRHESEVAGLEAISDRIEGGDIDLVAIHDAARPFVSQDLLCRILAAAREVGGAVPGLELGGEFLLRVSEDDAPAPVPTQELRRVQTPQAFRAPELLTAYRRATEAGFHGVDTAGPVERFTDLTVEVVPGDPRNIKVTFVGDLVTAEELAATWDPMAPSGTDD
jgi:2-C-methyl-D-erythritol 4-phosphate cytidylyltransferase